MAGEGDQLGRLSIAPLDTAPATGCLAMHARLPCNVDLHPTLRAIQSSVMAQPMLPGLSESWHISEARLDRTTASAHQYPKLVIPNLLFEGREKRESLVSSFKAGVSEHFGSAIMRNGCIDVPQARANHLTKATPG